MASETASGYARAMKIMDEEWIAAGTSREELERSEELTDIFDRLMGSEATRAAARAAWEAEYPDALSIYLRLIAIAEHAPPPDGLALAQRLRSLMEARRARGGLAAAQSPLSAPAPVDAEYTNGELRDTSAHSLEYAARLCSDGEDLLPVPADRSAKP